MSKGKGNYRNQMIAKIQVEFPKLRRDVDGDELRQARLEFYRETLGLNYTPASTTKLSNEQLGRVLDRMKEVSGQRSEVGEESAVRSQKSEVQPNLANCKVHPLRPRLSAIAATKRGVGCGLSPSPPLPFSPSAAAPASSGEIVHLAGNAQAWACARVMDHLAWPDQKRREYISKRFRRTSEKMLSPDADGRLLVQLLTIAAHASLKRRLGPDVKINREQTAAEIPIIKRNLGIDRSA